MFNCVHAICTCNGTTLLDCEMYVSSRNYYSVGHIDPVAHCVMAIAQRIKGTLGITGLSLSRVRISRVVWHLDVGSSHPGAECGAKGLAVR